MTPRPPGDMDLDDMQFGDMDLGDMEPQVFRGCRARRPRVRAILRSGAAVAVLCLAGAVTLGPGRAQESDGANPGGVRLTFGISASLTADDNIDLDFGTPEDTVRQETRLSFGLSSQTAVQSLALNFNTGFLFDNRDDDAGGGAQTQDPRATLRYSREGATSRFSARAEYRSTQLDSSDPLSVFDPADPSFDPDDPLVDPTDPTDPTFNTDDLAVNQGERQTTTASVVYDIGIDAPLGLTLEADTRRRDYVDTVDPDLFDTTTDTVAATARLRFSPLTGARLALSQEDFSAEDVESTDRITREVSLGLNQQVNSTLSFDASLGLSQIETTETLGGLRQERSSDGTTAALSATQDLGNGTIGASFERSFGVNGERDTLRVSRGLELPRGSLSGSLGATRAGGGGGTEVVASLSYGQDLPNGRIGATLERDVATSSQDDDVLATRIGFDYTTDLGPLSRFSLGLDYARTETGSGDGAVVPRDRTTLSATWSRDLSEEVQLSARYQHRIRTEADETARGNLVSLTLSRRFDLRP